MLPAPFPNQLLLLIPDLGIAQAGFHDVVIENLAATPTWRSRHLYPGDEGRISNNVETFDGCGATPTTFSSSPGVGVSSQSAGFLLPV